MSSSFDFRMRREILLLVTALGLPFMAAGVGGAQASCPSPAQRQETERALQGVLDSVARASADVPGVALTVLAPSRCLTWSGAAGVADTRTRRPLTPRDPHRIASNTKTYTAAAVLRLMEEGKLALEDRITRHLSAEELAPLRRDGYDVERITVRQLLTHTGGLYDYATDNRFVSIVLSQPTHRWTRTEQVDSAMVWGDAYGAPGQVFHYTDTGYILLGRMIERLSGMALAPALRTLLSYESLGLSSTWLETLEPPPTGVPERAHQYMSGDDTYDIDPSFDLYGGGGLAATTEDMARFTRALFKGGVFARQGTIDTMLEVPAGSTGPRVYALGLSRAEVDGEVLWGHSGFWNTLSYHSPARDVTVSASVTQQGRSAEIRTLLHRALSLVPR